MEINNNIINNKFEIFKSPSALNIIFISIFIAITAYIFVYLEFAVFFPALSLLIILLYYSYKSNSVFVITSILILPFILLSRDEEMKVSELFANAYLLGGMCLYFIKYHLIRREKIIENWADLFLILFFLFCITNISIAYLNNVELFSWLRGLLTFSLYLLYFPFRRYLKQREKLNYFIVAFSLCAIAICLHHINYIVFNLVRATLAYQLTSSLRINLTLISLSFLLSLILYFEVKPKPIKILLFITIFLSIASVITSFARATWLIVLALFVLAYVLLNFKQRIRIFLIGLFSLITLAVLFPNSTKNIDVYFKLINKKFISSTEGKSDISIRSRFYEYRGVFAEVEQYPISGSGINKVFKYKNILKNNTTSYQTFTHNSFLHLWYMLGIPTSLCLILFLLIITLKSVYLLFIKSGRTNTQAKLAFITFSGMMISISHSIVSAQLTSIETILTIVVSAAILNNELISAFKNNEEIDNPNYVNMEVIKETNNIN